jgi:phage terminase small subunit
MTLTAKQERFVAEYLIDLNGTQAAVRAGYNPNSASEQASRLLSNAKIAAAVAEAQAKRQARTEVTQDRVIAELARIGFADIRKAVRWGNAPAAGSEDIAYPVELVSSDEVDDDTAAAITEVSLTAQGVKIKLADKRAALETLLKHVTGAADPSEAPSLTVNINAAPAIGDVRVTRSDG